MYDNDSDNDLKLEFDKLVRLAPASVVLVKPKRMSRPLYEILETRLALLLYLRLGVNYFSTRHTLEPYTRRYMDIFFMYHYFYDHYMPKIQNKTPNTAKLPEKLHYQYLRNVKYRQEVDSIWFLVDGKKRPKFVEKYHDAYLAEYATSRDNTDLLDHFH